MVKSKNNDNPRKPENQGEMECARKASKVGASTKYEYCRELLSPFGGLLGLVKFMELINFKEIFDGFYKAPSRKPILGHRNMVYGLIILLYIGFTRVWHFVYVQHDPMVCSIFNVVKLPYVTTYWRYVNSIGINQGKSLLMVMSAIRERVWQLSNICYTNIHIDIDTTVETIFGDQEGGRKGHNTKARGKKGYRPVLCFISETREYIVGKLRKGETMGGDEIATVIRSLTKYIPGCVKGVTLRGDGEFISGESVKAADDAGYKYIFGNKACNPPFDSTKWYKVRKTDKIEYNECVYQPGGWEKPCRFVVMRIPKEKEKGKHRQLELFEDANYKYRIFVTNLTGKPHKVISEYDKRADCENLIGEAKREGLSAIPTGKFATNYAYFQIVMLAYNIWRSFKILSGNSQLEKAEAEGDDKPEKRCPAKDVIDNTIRIARLKLLFIAAKITTHSNVQKIKYSQHDSRVSGFFKFLEYLDDRIKQIRPWLKGESWACKHLPYLGISQPVIS